jgi:hypothetical protein
MAEEMVELACLCGEVFRQRVAAPIASVMRRTWEKVHQGAGHGPTDPATAAKARQDQEEGLLRELDGPEAALTIKLLAALRSEGPMAGKSARRRERAAAAPPPIDPAPRG